MKEFRKFRLHPGTSCLPWRRIAGKEVSDDMFRRKKPEANGSIVSRWNREPGFSLVEVLIALIVASIALLAAAQLLYVSISSVSLARSKSTAALAAGSMLESLSDQYARDPSDGNLAVGSHGPREINITNPNNGAVLNRYRITWAVRPVPDPRMEKAPDALNIVVTVIPVRADGEENFLPTLNKTLSLSTLFSPRIR